MRKGIQLSEQLLAQNLDSSPDFFFYFCFLIPSQKQIVSMAQLRRSQTVTYDPTAFRLLGLVNKSFFSGLLGLPRIGPVFLSLFFNWLFILIFYFVRGG